MPQTLSKVACESVAGMSIALPRRNARFSARWFSVKPDQLQRCLSEREIGTEVYDPVLLHDEICAPP